LVLLSTSSVFAQQAGNAETIVVTATRTEQPLERTGESISVITRADLEAQQLVLVSDALAQTPGVTIVRNGGVGQLTTIGIRGAAAGQSLVLVDGVRINDPSSTDDEALLGDLFVNNIERIEILRGPQSTLYGSDAIGGVVDIITQRGGATPFSLLATGEGGSFGSARFNLAANGTDGELEYGAGANYVHTDGTPAADPRNGNTRDDRYTNVGLTENARLNLTDQVSVDLRSYYTNTRYDFDANFAPPLFLIADSTDYGTNQLAAGYLGLNADFFDGHFHNRLALIGSDSERKTFPNGGAPEEFFADGGAWRLEYQGIVDVDADNQATFGAESQTTTIATESIFDPARIKGADRIDSLYGQWQSTLFQQLTLTGGVRYDHDHAFGSHVSYKAAGAWSLFDGMTIVRANYGTGFKAPTLYELDSEYSNPITRLKPETARGWEAGFDTFLFDDRIKTSATYFSRNTSDQIDFFSCFGPASGPGCAQRFLVGGYYFNIDRTRADGVELEATAKLADTLTAQLSYTDMTAINLDTRTSLERRPQLLAHATLTWTPTADVTLGGTVGFVGKRWDDQANTMPLSSNTLVNLFGSYQLTDSLQVFARVENLFGIRYEPVTGYGAPRRGVFAGVKAAI
jgi:vitamin B12 transporter